MNKNNFEKAIEKPMFKEGDKITNGNVTLHIMEIEKFHNRYITNDEDNEYISFSSQNQWKLC